MNKLIPLSFIFLIFFACKKPKDSRLNNEGLAGVWIVKNVNLIDRLFKDFKSLKSTDKLENNQLLNVYYFDKNNNFTIDTGSVNTIKGTYKIDDSLLQLTTVGNVKSTINYVAMEIIDTTKMRLYTDYLNEEDKLVYEFRKISTGEIMNIDWKKPLTAAATEVEIKDRLKMMLLYYGSYFRTLSNNNIGFFNAQRVNLPVKLYDGGVGLIETDKITNDFITIMGSQQNALTAYKVLQNCFKEDFNYPSNETNLSAEYAIVLKHLAKSVK